MIPNLIGSKKEMFGGGDIGNAVTETQWLSQYEKLQKMNGNPITVVTTEQTEVYEHNVSDLQEDIVIKGSKITGTLKYVEDGALPTTWDNNYFIALDFKTFPEDATSVTVELVPSLGHGPAELIEDLERCAVMSIDKDENDKPYQKLVVKTTTGKEVLIQTFELKELILQPVD